MLSIRLAIIGLPLLVIGLLIASYLSVDLTPPRRANEISIGTIGEAHILNPIQSTTAADSEVTGFIFNGLLTYNEDLELKSDLAERWEQSQTTTLYFGSANQAERAAQSLRNREEEWEGWDLAAVRVEEEALLLKLSMPGGQPSRKLYEQVDTETAVPLTILQIVSEKPVRELIQLFRETGVTAGAIRRTWFDTPRVAQIIITGDPEKFIQEFRKFIAANQEVEPEIIVADTVPYLDEPQIDFYLREGVAWHDGAPFSSADVVFTYRMIMDETMASPRRADYERIRSVDALDDYHVRVVYRQLYSPALANWTMGILPKHILEGRGSSWWAENFNRSPIGTGPFKFHAWESNEYIELIRNDAYFLGAPHLDRVTIRTIPDPLTIRLAFETRQIDFWNVDPHAVGRFGEDDRFDFFSAPSRNYSYVGWNLERPVFQDRNVRRALAHAVDVESMIKYLIYGNGVQSTGIYPPQMWYANPDIEPLEYDPEKARRLLAEAGWEPGRDGILRKDGKKFSFTLLTNQGNELRKDIMTLVQRDLRQVGIEVRTQIYEFAVFIDQYVNTKDFDAVVLGWSLGIDYDQYQIWHSSQTDPSQLNFVTYQNPEVDALLEGLRVEYDRDAIIKRAGQLQRIIYEDQPYLFLFVPNNTSVVWKDEIRVLRPEGGEWIEEPIRMTAAGFRVYQEWFYRPDHPPAALP